MKSIWAIIFVIGFVAILFTAVPAIGQSWAPWFNTVLAALFVSLFLIVSRGKAWVALSVVAFFTIIFPLIVLMFIGWGIYPSTWVLTKAIFSACFDHGQFWGLEMLFPLLGGGLVATAIQPA